MRRQAVLCAALVALAACADAPEEDTVTAPMHEGAEVIAVTEEEGPSGLLPPAEGENAWRIDKANSQIMFTGRQADEAFTGRFGRFDAQIVFDPQDLESASIVGAVDLGTADAGTTERNESLPEPNWFDVAAHPVARFTSSEIRQKAEGSYEAFGTFELKGVTQEIVMPFTLAIAGDRAVAEASMALDRSDYGIGQGEFASGDWVGFDVGVAIHLEADRAETDGAVGDGAL